MTSGLQEASLTAAKKEQGGRPEMVFPLLLLLPAVMLMLALYALPFASSIYRSFLTKQGALTLGNYGKAIELYLPDVFFTLEVSVLSTAIAAVVSVALATYLRLADSRLSRAVGELYRFPIFVPFVVVAQMMRTFLAPHGLLNIFLAQVGLINLDSPLQLFNLEGLTFSFAWKQAPFMVLIILGGFQMVDDAFIESARSVGAGMFQVISKILIPMSQASISVAVILAFSSTVGTFTLPYMLIGGKAPTTVTVDIAHRVNYFGDWGVANALGVFSYIMVFFTAVYYLRYAVRKGIYEV
jgi:putative spermidine/putrescine transport system permease protein